MVNVVEDVWVPVPWEAEEVASCVAGDVGVGAMGEELFDFAGDEHAGGVLVSTRWCEEVFVGDCSRVAGNIGH